MAKWGTVNEPKKTGRYLVTITTSFGNQVRQADRCKTHIGTWNWHLIGSTGYASNIIAWQKCPKPYDSKVGK